MLVGGGELHDRWSSLVGVSAPLSRGIQRFTGISQAMVDARAAARGGAARARPAAARPRARRPLGALRPRRAARGVRARRARLARPAGAVHRRDGAPPRAAPAPPRPRRARRRAGGRGGGDAPRAARRGDLRARVLRAVLPPVRARRDGRRRGRAARAARAAPAARPRAAARRRRRPPERRPDLSSLPARSRRLRVPRRRRAARCTWASRSACARGRGRTSRRRPTWTGEAEHVDYQATESELGALLLEDRLIKTLRPPGNKRGKRGPDGYVYLRCRLDIAFPILEVAREPAGGHAVTVGPVRGRAAAAELVEQLNSLFGLRHCGRALPRRDHPCAYGQMGRCLSPCLGDLDPNLYRERLDAALRLFVDGPDGGAALLAHIDGQMRDARARAALRARGLAAAPAGAAGGAAAPARRGAARDPRGRAARARAASGGAAAASTRSGSRAGASSTGARCRAIPASCSRAARPPCGPRRGRSSAAGCRPPRWRRRASSAPGWRRTSRPCSSSARHAGEPAGAIRPLRPRVRGMIAGIDHVQLAAPPGCEEEARRFFGGVLGLEEVPQARERRGRRRRLVPLRRPAAPRRRRAGVRARAQGPSELRRRRHRAARRGRRAARRGGTTVTWDAAHRRRHALLRQDPWGNRLEFRAV